MKLFRAKHNVYDSRCGDTMIIEGQLFAFENNPDANLYEEALLYTGNDSVFIEIVDSAHK